MRTNNVESCYQSGQTGFFIYATCCQTHMSWECSHEQADINRIWKCEKMLENCFEENRCCQETFECRLCVWIQFDSIFEIEFRDTSWVQWRCSSIYPYCLVGKFPPFIVMTWWEFHLHFANINWNNALLCTLWQSIAMTQATLYKRIGGHSIYRL